MASPRRRPPSRGLLAGVILLWALVSIAAIIVLPLWISALYVVSCAIGYVVWARRFKRRRIADLAESSDLLRPGDQPRAPDRPSGGVHGRHSWSRPD